jgi:hypothetical protein
MNTTRGFLQCLFNEIFMKEVVLLLHLENAFVSLDTNFISSVNTTKPGISSNPMLLSLVFNRDTV